MDENFTRQEKELLKAKTPSSYIDRSLHSKISSGRKATLTRYWLQRTGYSIDDIKYARNRHPYWKAKKMEGTADRNLVRSLEHDYSEGGNIEWDDDLILEFIHSNGKGKNGRYEYHDWELARHFKCSIPAIQHMRRKYNMSVRLIEAELGRVTEKRLLEYMRDGEGSLRRRARKLKRKR